MSNKKQSSVEWFAEKTFNLIELLKRSYVSQEEFLGGMFKFRDEAKAMQENEYFEFFKAGQESMEEGGKGFEQYYNETFGGEQ